MRLLLWLLRLCGFTNLYALVPVAEWKEVRDFLKNLEEMEATGKHLTGLTETTRDLLEQLPRIKQMAEEAHIMACNGLPVSAVAATKIAGQIVVSGMEMPDPKQFMTNKQED